MVGDSANISCKTNCSDTYLSLAAEGLGLVCIPCFVAAKHSHLRRVLADEYDEKIELWMVTHPDFQKTGRIRVFLDFVRDEVRRDRHTLAGISSGSF